MDSNLKNLNEVWAGITTKMYQNAETEGNETNVDDINDVEFEEVKNN